MAESMQVLVRRKDGFRQVAVLCRGQLLEYMHEEGATDSLVGSVLLGTVERVLPSVGAAFVKIGQPQNGFLPLTEQESFTAMGPAALVTGQEALVQVKKDPVGEKGAFLTRDIALPGQYLLLLPMNRYVGVSSRVTEESERQAALALGKELAGKQAGVIVRHGALMARRQDVQAEWESLQETWADIQAKARHQKPPATLYQEPSALQGILRDYGARYEISVQSVEEGNVNEMELDALWQGAGIQRQIEEAIARKVQLQDGGTLVIDEREALTTIDVNSARFTGIKDQTASLALAQNLSACAEVARQIRLRNLGGIIIIDFIDMESDQERAQVQEALQLALADDRRKAVIHGFTRLGLLEMTRKRTRESLLAALGQKTTKQRKGPSA